jgi:hypothetical protein
MIVPFQLSGGPELAALKRQIDQADAVTPELMRGVIEATCGSLTEDKSGRTSAIWRLVRADAPVDTALALIDTVLPGWCVRRICHEDGQWWCAMNARQPVYWDADEVDVAHPVLALAILKAFVTALEQTRSAVPRRASVTEAQQARPLSWSIAD